MELRGRAGQFLIGIQTPFRSPWSTNLIAFAVFVVLLPLLAVAIYRDGAGWLNVFFVSVFITFIWQALFARIRHHPMPIDGIVTALSFSLVLSPSVPIWQVALSLSFGIVVGQEIFGGWGRNFLNPAVVALAFLMFSFPNTAFGELGGLTAIAVLPGGLLLGFTGLISWRVLLGAIAAMIASGYVTGIAEPLSGFLTGGFAFGLVFFACDPVSSASTNPGRWIYAFLFGILTVLLAGIDAGISIRSVVFAALLSSILAPLIDQGVIWTNVYRRRRRHG